MSAGVVVAELVARFIGEDESFRKANLATQQGLVKTAGIAGDTADEMVRLALSSVSAGNALEGTSVQAATFNRVAGTSIKVADALATSFGNVDRAAIGLEGALDIAGIAAKAVVAEFGLVDKSAVDMGIALAAARTEVQGLGRSLGSNAATGYAKRADASTIAVEALGIKATATAAQVNALNAAIASGKTLSLPTGGAGGGAGTGGSGRQKWEATTGAFATKVGLPVLAIGAVASKVAMDFDAATTRVVAFAGATKQEMDAMRPRILGLGETYGIQSKEIADGFFHIRSAITDAKVASDVLAVSAKAAGAGLGHMEDVTYAITSARYSFAKPAKEIGDIVAKAATLSHADPAAYFRSMGQAIPIAANLKLKLNDIAGLVAIMTREGQTPAQGFQRVTSMMESLTAPTPKQKNVAKMLGIDFGAFRLEMQQNIGAALEEVYTKSKGNLERIKQFFGGRKAGDAALGFFNPNAVEENIRVLKEMANTAGTVDHAWAAASGSTRVSVAKMDVAVQNAAIGLGTALAPAVIGLAGDVKGLADGFSHLSPAVQANIVEVGAIVATVGVLGNVTLKGVGAVSAFGGVLTTASRALGIASLASRAAAASGLALNAAFLPEIATLALVAGAAYGLYKAYQYLTDGGKSERQVLLDGALANQKAAEAKAADGKKASDLAQEYAQLAKHVANLTARHEDTRQPMSKMHGIMDELRVLSPKVAKGFDDQAGSLIGIAKNANLATKEYAKLDAEARKAALKVATTKLVNLANSRAYVQESLDHYTPGSGFYQDTKEKLDRMNANYAKLKLEQLALIKGPQVDEAKVGDVKEGGSKRPPIDYSDPGPVTGGKGRKQKEATDYVGKLRDQAYEIQKATDLAGDARQSSALAYDIAHKHLEGLGQAGGDLGKRIVAHANDWIASAQGKASCAAFASGIIKAAGGGIAPTMSAKGLRDEAIKAGAVGHPLSEAKPGDLIIYRGRAYGATKYSENGETVGYHAAIALGGGRLRGSNDGVARTRSFYDPGHATAYTLPGGGGGKGGDAAIIAQATANVELLKKQEAKDEARKAADKARDAAQDQNDAVRDATKEAWRAANETAREVLYQRVLANRPSAYGPNLNRDIVAQGIAIHEHGVLLDNLPKAIQAAITARSLNERRAAGMAYQPEAGLFDDGSETAKENKAKRTKEATEAALKSAENYRTIMDRLADRKGEGDAASSLAARRAQYIREQVGDLKTSGNLFTDAQRMADVVKAAGAAFDATPLRAYRDAIRGLTREFRDLRGQTEAARLAAIRYDADGTERMGPKEAQKVLDLQKLLDQERAFRERSRQMGESAGTAFSDGLHAGLTGGIRKGILGFLQSADSQIRESLVGSASRGFSAWVTRSMNRTDPSRPKDPGMSGKGGFWGGIGGAIFSAMGGKNAALAANTTALNALTLKLATAGLGGAAGGAGGGIGGILGGLFGGGGGLGGTTGLDSLGWESSYAPGVQAFARGGHYEKGVPRMTSERGAEFDVPDHSGTVLPADLTARMMTLVNTASDGGSLGGQMVNEGDTHVHIHVNGGSKVDRRDLDSVRRAAHDGVLQARRKGPI